MFKNKKKNREIEEANAEAELTLSDYAVHVLLDRIDYEGYKPTYEEIAALKKVESISLIRIPRSIDFLANLQWLDLSGTQIADLSEIKNLTNLQELYLKHSPITSICGIENLTNLQKLYFSDTRITSINGIGNLTKLQKLSLWGTNIISICCIKNLTNLQELDLGDTQITDLSGIENLINLQKLCLGGTKITNLKGIEKLTNLQELDLAETQITCLNGIEKLTNLRELNLSFTQITDLSGIENLINLQWLNLGYTQIDSNVLEKLAKLKNLRYLYLTHLKLAKIPPQLLELNLPFDTTSMFPAGRGIYLYGTELTQQPLSLFEQDRSLIEKYYESEMEKVGEAKVIFLGHGGVGKTHTIERIKEKGEIIKSIEGETPGIQITSIKEFDGTGLNVQFWDFGGQDIMHSMHRCFLTERSCYVIVVNTRQGDVNKKARYWLNNIKSFAPNAPVILFENRWGKGLIGGGLDENRLKKEFPNVRLPIRSFSAACAKKNEFELLIEDIRAVAGELDSVKMEFPEKWAKIREKLLELKDKDKPFIEKEKYYELCRDCGEYSPDIAKWLLSWFNDLGVCFSYHQDRETNKELESYQLLAPNWIINAMYTIINNAEELCDGGIIYRKNIKSILKEGSASLARSLDPDANYEDRTDYILEVMRKFRLSHKVSDTKEFIPALCENNTPKDLHPDKWVKHITYKYVYQFLPDNVVHQMMIFWKQKGHLEPTKLWLKGFRIDFYTEGNAFVIDMGNDDNILLIDVYSLKGNSTYNQFICIKENIDKINNCLGLSPYECISVEENGIKQDLPISPLRKMWDRGIRTYTILDRVDYAEIELCDVLEGIIYPDKSRKVDRLYESIGEEKMMKKAEEAKGNAGNGAQNNTTIINGNVITHGDSFFGNSNTVNKRYTDEQMTKLFEVMFAHQDRITKEVLDTIAEMVEKQGEQQPNLDADKIKDIIVELKKPSPKTTVQRIQTCFDNIAKGWTMGKDILKWIIPFAIAQHAPEITDAVQTLLK